VLLVEGLVFCEELEDDTDCWTIFWQLLSRIR